MSPLSLSYKSHVASLSCFWGEMAYSLEFGSARYLVVLDKCTNFSKTQEVLERTVVWESKDLGSRPAASDTCYIVRPQKCHLRALSLGFLMWEEEMPRPKWSSVREEGEEVMLGRQPAMPTTELSSAYCIPALSVHYLISHTNPMR